MASSPPLRTDSLRMKPSRAKWKQQMEKRDRFLVTPFEPLDSAIPEASSKSFCSWLHPPVHLPFILPEPVWVVFSLACPGKEDHPWRGPFFLIPVEKADLGGASMWPGEVKEMRKTRHRAVHGVRADIPRAPWSTFISEARRAVGEPERRREQRGCKR